MSLLIEGMGGTSSSGGYRYVLELSQTVDTPISLNISASYGGLVYLYSNDRNCGIPSGLKVDGKNIASSIMYMEDTVQSFSTYIFKIPFGKSVYYSAWGNSSYPPTAAYIYKYQRYTES